MRYRRELTDTYGGEANYSWVNRATIEVPDNATDLLMVRRAKEALNVAGVRCRRYDDGETITLRPCNSNTIIFISPCYEESNNG